jgi:hypothetical protein
MHSTAIFENVRQALQRCLLTAAIQQIVAAVALEVAWIEECRSEYLPLPY